MLLQLLCSLLAAYGVTYVICLAWKHLKLRSVINIIPGPYAIPFIGDALKIKYDTHGFFYQVYDLCRRHAAEGITKLWVGPRPIVLLYKAHTVQEVLCGSKHMKKGPGYRFFIPWIGEGLAVSSGEKWHAGRKLMTPMFHFKVLVDYMHVFNKHAKILVGHLDKMADGQDFDILPYLKYCAMDMICESTLGVKTNAQSGNESHIVQAVAKQSEMILTRVRSPWLWPDLMFRLSTTGRLHAHNLRILHDYAHKTIQRRRVDRAATVQLQHQNMNSEKAKPHRLAFIDTLLEQQANNKDSSAVLDDSAVEKEINALIAGNDPVGTAAMWVVYMLGWNNEEQTKVQQELDRVFGDTNDSELTIDNISELKYLDCFIKETLRLYPAAAWFSRTTSEPCQIDGFEIPEGIELMVFVPQLHRDPEFFPDPEKFDPDRWLNDGMAARHPFCYVPFSAGLRNCIGQRFTLLQVKTMVCYILRKFTLRCTMKRDEVVAVARPLLKPTVPMHVTLRRRD